MEMKEIEQVYLKSKEQDAKRAAQSLVERKKKWHEAAKKQAKDTSLVDLNFNIVEKYEDIQALDDKILEAEFLILNVPTSEANKEFMFSCELDEIYVELSKKALIRDAKIKLKDYSIQREQLMAHLEEYVLAIKRFN